MEGLREDIDLLLLSTSLISKIIIESHHSTNFISEYKYISIIFSILNLRFLNKVCPNFVNSSIGLMANFHN